MPPLSSQDVHCIHHINPTISLLTHCITVGNRIDASMAPTLILIRHAQALHNVDKDYDIPDPPLSELGLEQCEELHDNLQRLPLADRVELIVVSPMRRTLQTATIGLDFLVRRGVKVLPDAGWQGMHMPLLLLPLCCCRWVSLSRFFCSSPPIRILVLLFVNVYCLGYAYRAVARLELVSALIHVCPS